MFMSECEIGIVQNICKNLGEFKLVMFGVVIDLEFELLDGTGNSLADVTHCINKWSKNYSQL